MRTHITARTAPHVRYRTHGTARTGVDGGVPGGHGGDGDSGSGDDAGGDGGDGETTGNNAEGDTLFSPVWSPVACFFVISV